MPKSLLNKVFVHIKLYTVLAFHRMSPNSVTVTGCQCVPKAVLKNHCALMHDVPLADFRNVYAIIYPTSHIKLGDT